MPRAVLFVVVGASGSGKGILLRALRDMGERRVVVIRKATSRRPKTSDGPEMVNYEGRPFPRKYDIIYGNYRARYGIASTDIWRAITTGKHALLICSNFVSRDELGQSMPGLVDAIPRLHSLFGPLMRLVYLHSATTADSTRRHLEEIATEDAGEIETRMEKVDIVRRYYVDNAGLFDHVLLNVLEPEDLSDQMFRLVRLYDGDL